LGCRPASQQGAHAVGSAPGLPPSTCEAALSFSLACASSSKPPRPGRCTSGAFISDPKERLRLTARRLVPRLRPRSFWRFPPRAPQRGASPTAARAGCPRVALPRASTDAPRQSTVNTEALFQSLRLPAQILSEDQAAEPQGIKAMPVTQTRPAPRLGRPRPVRFRGIGSNGQSPFFVKPPRFYLHGSRSSRSCLTAIHLEPLQFYLFGLLEKKLRVYEVFVCCSTNASTNSATFAC